MQTQDAPAEFIFKLWPWLEANRNRLVGFAIAIIAAIIVFLFISSQRAQKEITAGQAMTELLMSPSQTPDGFVSLANQYAGTAAGQRARLQAGAALFDAGRYADAQAQFEKLTGGNSSGQFAATAQLGIATCLDAQGKLADAANAYQKVINSFPSSSCVSAAEFALGRIAQQQGKLPEAESHFESAARASIGGTLAQEAAGRAMEIKNKLAVAAPKSATNSQPAFKLQ